jgi:hypothetical protein
MARLLTCGYETGDLNEAGQTTLGTNGVMSVASSAPTPRAGSYCLRIGPPAVTTVNQGYKTFALPAVKTDLWVRWAVFLHGIPSTEVIASMLDSAAAAHTTVTWSGVDALLRVNRGATVLGISSSTMTPDAWHVLEWRTQMTSLTSGTSELWLDGNRVINVTGVDNSNATNLGVQSVTMGTPGAIVVAGWYIGVDDIAINDTAGTRNNGRPGDGRVVLLTPSGAGSSTVLTRGGTDTGANWSQTSEIPPSMTQYVLSANAGDRDLYATADLPVAVSAINVVEELLLVQNSDAGAGAIGPTIKSGAATNELTAISVTNTAAYVTGRWETDPNTSAAWTAAAVNALEIGATVR